ncbi:MAG: formyltetrahydrofolate deformylase [Trueperaceae bacterium]|nr:formyltetrahydrofolate deformylase [Trueperaceae bacterium]
MVRRVPTARLLIDCPDRPGIVAAVSGFLFARGANVLDARQHSTDPEGGTFFMRMAFRPERPDVDREALAEAFAREVAQPFGMRWRIAWSDVPKRMAILASKADHALLELLWRWRNGELSADLRVVASNHDRLRGVVGDFGVPFHHLPIGDDGREAQEAALRTLLLEEGVELVVLARYMQILGPAFVATWPDRIVNIHHSFLPAFVGANPYRQAYERGVKLIGATAHYVTDDLDEGPIIAQDVVRVSHRQSLRDLVQLGSEVERTVLARAVAAHLRDAILVHGNKTVVFD